MADRCGLWYTTTEGETDETDTEKILPFCTLVQIIQFCNERSANCGPTTIHETPDDQQLGTRKCVGRCFVSARYAHGEGCA